MPIEPIFQELSPISLHLDQLFLDPNNPRFTEANWTHVPEADFQKGDVQERTMRRLVTDFDVDKLRMSMEVNGFLPIDRTVVRQFAVGKYIVLEGNRRICAAKKILQGHSEGAQLNPKVIESLQEIPCLLYTGTDSDAAWIFQGLRHISGVVEWSAFNKAKLLVEQMEAEGMTLTEVGQRFGLTPHGAGQWVRGYRAFNQARQESDYTNEVDEKSYPYFQEIFSRTSAPVREWMEWNETEERFDSLLNFNEFVGWLYPRADVGDGTNSKGDFEKRWLARRDDIRSVAHLLTKAPEFFSQFRAGGDLEKAYSLALAQEFEAEAKKTSDPVAEVFVALQLCTKALENIPLRAIRDEAVKARLDLELAKLTAAIAQITPV